MTKFNHGIFEMIFVSFYKIILFGKSLEFQGRNNSSAILQMLIAPIIMPAPPIAMANSKKFFFSAMGFSGIFDIIILTLEWSGCLVLPLQVGPSQLPGQERNLVSLNSESVLSYLQESHVFPCPLNQRRLE